MEQVLVSTFSLSQSMDMINILHMVLQTLRGAVFQYVRVSDRIGRYWT
jgi:hypothetical protein